MPVKETRIDARSAEQSFGFAMRRCAPCAPDDALRGRWAGAGACQTHPDMLVELGQYGHHPIDREATELCIADARKIRSRYSGHLLGFPDGDLLIVQNADDLGGKNCLELKHLGIGASEVAEHVAASADKLKIVVVTLGHRRASFNRLSRSRIRSISACGVLIPFFDFF
jgi:hypothetical protein